VKGLAHRYWTGLSPALRRYYRATPKGRAALQAVKPQVRELFSEVIGEHHPASHHPRGHKAGASS